MRFQIAKEVRFEASHQLMGLPEDHSCSRLHGHSYITRVALESEELDEVGFVFDFGVVSEVIKGTFDHRHLNEVMGGKRNPTAENIALFISQMLHDVLFKMGCEEVKIVEVSVFETSTSKATVYP